MAPTKKNVFLDILFPEKIFACPDQVNVMHFILSLKYLPDPERKDLEELMRHCGANLSLNVDNTTDFSTIIVDHDVVVSTKAPAFTIYFLRDCLKEGKLEDIKKYRQNATSHIARHADCMDIIYHRKTCWSSVLTEEDKLWLKGHVSSPGADDCPQSLKSHKVVKPSIRGHQKSSDSKGKASEKTYFTLSDDDDSELPVPEPVCYDAGKNNHKGGENLEESCHVHSTRKRGNVASSSDRHQECNGHKEEIPSKKPYLTLSDDDDSELQEPVCYDVGKNKLKGGKRIEESSKYNSIRKAAFSSDRNLESSKHKGKPPPHNTHFTLSDDGDSELEETVCHDAGKNNPKGAENIEESCDVHSTTKREIVASSCDRHQQFNGHKEKLPPKEKYFMLSDDDDSELEETVCYDAGKINHKGAENIEESSDVHSTRKREIIASSSDRHQESNEHKGKTPPKKSHFTLSDDDDSDLEEPVCYNIEGNTIKDAKQIEESSDVHSTKRKENAASFVECEEAFGENLFSLKKEKKVRQPYTQDEKEKILKYIIHHNGLSCVKGRDFWMIMERRKVCPNRTWQSMKEHFLKKIVLNLDDFDFLSETEKKKIKSSIG